MSEVKVNKVSSRTGNAVTLGNSGDTLTVPSGVTITSAGTVSGGFKDIQWQSVITADGSTSTTAEAGKGYFIDCTSGAHTINLPASPSIGDTVAIADYAGTFGTNNVTVGRNGSKIQGVATNATISTNQRATTFVYIDSTKGWIPVNDNTAANYGAQYITATGGTATTSGNYKIHTFNSSGCFVVSCAGNPAGSTKIDYLVVAGGGGGGGGPSGDGGGGGGGGGYRESAGTDTGSYTVSPLGSGVSSVTASATTYPITVGAGGSGGSGSPGVPGGHGGCGSNSVFSTITSAGGGGGGYGGSPESTGGSHPGRNGGSGGGGAAGGTGPHPGGTGNTPPVSPSQGTNGGGGGQPASPDQSGGGGGGATAAGSHASGTNGGAGGNGATSCITGSPVGRAGGAPGMTSATGTAVPGGSFGAGGGGKNGGPIAGAGTANTGGGGGGAGNSGSPTAGGAGGSGVVILRYKYQ